MCGSPVHARPTYCVIYAGAARIRISIDGLQRECGHGLVISRAMFWKGRVMGGDAVHAGPSLR